MKFLFAFSLVVGCGQKNACRAIKCLTGDKNAAKSKWYQLDAS